MTISTQRRIIKIRGRRGDANPARMTISTQRRIIKIVSIVAVGLSVVGFILLFAWAVGHPDQYLAVAIGFACGTISISTGWALLK